MMRPEALMEAVSANLHWFLQPIGENLTKPQKKFLQDGLIGLLRAGRPVVCRMARKLHDRGTQFLSRLDRLQGHLNQQDDLDEKVKAALPGQDVGKVHTTTLERGVIASKFFAPALSPMTILCINGCRFVETQAKAPHIAIAKVAGFDTAVYGLPEKDVFLLCRKP